MVRPHPLRLSPPPPWALGSALFLDRFDQGAETTGEVFPRNMEQDPRKSTFELKPYYEQSITLTDFIVEFDEAIIDGHTDLHSFQILQVDLQPGHFSCIIVHGQENSEHNLWLDYSQTKPAICRK